MRQAAESGSVADQMAALLGPSWKSRPRMCQLCQGMFSNKFNLKQVGANQTIEQR